MSNATFQIPVRERQFWRLQAQRNLRQRFKPLLATPQSANRRAVWEAMVARVGPETPVTLLEFGVYEGRSVRFWAEHFTNPASRFHGFDSFEGLPEFWDGKMVKGTFSTEGATPDIDDSRVQFHKGWIQNTLPPMLAGLEVPDDHQLIVHIDTDLYSAALFVLSTLWHGFDSYVFVFDEFSVDENRALADFASAYPVDLEFMGHSMHPENKLPLQVYGRLDKVPYTV